MLRRIVIMLMLLLLPGSRALAEVVTPTDVITPAEVSTPTDVITPPDALAVPASERFLPEGQPAVLTDSSYRSSSIAIDITRRRVEGSDVYVADIYVRTTDSLRRAYGGGQWNRKTQSVRTLAEDSGAILAITGDSAQNITAGLVIGNGELLRSTPNLKRDLCVLYTDGVMKTLLAASIDHDALLAQQDRIWQTFLFGPVLLDEHGRAMTIFNTNVSPANPRSAIGYYAPGHYCFVQVDGRRTASAIEKGKTNAGMTMQQLSALMESLGCAAAYNLDGGQSSMLWFGGQVISTPYKGGRRVGDIVLIAEDAPAATEDDTLLVKEESP